MKPLAVLCIDDEEMVLDSLAMELELQFPDLELVLLENQSEAESVADEATGAGHEIAVIICDYIMPGRRGDQVLASLHRRLPDARTIMLTGQSSLDGVTNAINQANLFRYLAKPWDSDDLRLTVQAALDSFLQEREIRRANHELRALNDSLEVKVQERTRDLTQAHDQIREYVDIIDDNVLISRIDHDGNIISVSRAFCERYGYRSEDLIGRSYWKTLCPRSGEQQMAVIRDCIGRGQPWEGELEHVARDGRRYWAHEIISPNTSQGALVVGFTTIIQDITDRKIVEQMSITDALTELHNRRYFDSTLARRVKQGRQDDEYLALALFDIDHFKQYNDNYGHAAGDTVLRSIGAVLRSSFDHQGALSFRIGGEEFAVLLNVSGEQQARAIAELIEQTVAVLAIRHEFSPTAEMVTVSGGIGLARPDEALASADLYEFTDGLLYRSKRSGRNRITLAVMPESAMP